MSAPPDPPPLDPTPLLRTRALGRTLELHERIDSTNERARALAREGAPHGALVAAREQTAGRGRLGRRWASPRDGGVYASWIVRLPGLPLARAPMMTLVVGVAAQRAAVALAGSTDVGLKWPNDLWVARGPLAGRKLGGILVETSAIGDRLEAAVLGLGLNLREVARPPELAEVASSLEALSGAQVSPAAALAALSEALEEELDRWSSNGPAPVLERWRAVALGVGRPIRVGDRAGVLRGVAEDGALLLEADGAVARVYAGDVELDRAHLTADS